MVKRKGCGPAEPRAADLVWCDKDAFFGPVMWRSLVTLVRATVSTVCWVEGRL